MSQSVKDVSGIGPKTAIFLEDKGVRTVRQLIRFGVSGLSGAPGFSEARARTVLAAAELLDSGDESKSVLSTIEVKAGPIDSEKKKSGKKKKVKDKKKGKKNKKDKDKKNKEKDKKKKGKKKKG